MLDKIKNTIYSIVTGIEDGWQYPHHVNYNDGLYVRVMNVTQVSRLAYEVYKSAGLYGYREVLPFSVKPKYNSWANTTDAHKASFKQTI